MEYYPRWFFGIISKPELLNTVNELTEDEEIRDSLTINKVWIIEEKIVLHQSLMIYPEQKVRLMHVANYYFEWVEDLIDANDPISDIVRSIIGTPPFDPDIFDRWWSLVPFGEANYIRECQAELPLEASDWFSRFDTKLESRWWENVFIEKRNTSDNSSDSNNSQ